MSLSEAELAEHCQYIIHSGKIVDRIVVLCEGDIPRFDGRLLPQLYSNMENIPDANFYYNCVPTGWKSYKPKFFNCGDRLDVLNTFFHIQDLHDADPKNSYLNPKQLFAIVDLDIQVANIKHNYIFTDTDSIFYDLYEKNKVNETNCINHRIWVTGLVHKEAYFILPDVQVVFNEYLATPIYKNAPIELDKIYIDMLESLHEDIDLQNNLEKTFNRINHCSSLDFDNINNFQNSWKLNFTNNKNNALILALLTIAKAKKYWNQIQPPQDSMIPAHRFREQLSQKVAKFYSQQECHGKNHIRFFFEVLSKFNNA